MAVTYQAGVGPSMTRCHIYRVPADPGDRVKLSLCDQVNVVLNYKADLSFKDANMCRRCAVKFLQEFEGVPTAADVGVTWLEL